MRNKYCLFIFLWICLCISCKEDHLWKFSSEIPLGNISPVSIAKENHFIWISDPAHNQLVKIEPEGRIVQKYSGFKRPMHIALKDNKIFVPEFLSDTIKILHKEGIEILDLPYQPDAPAGIDITNGLTAVVDFFNHRIIVVEKENSKVIGKKGHDPGELFYPTDVAIYEGMLYIADAYNNRVQVFDSTGKNVAVFGSKEKMNVASGIEVKNDQVFITDFFNNRLLIYDLNGNLVQTIDQNLQHPSDVLVSGSRMYVSNYQGNSISVFELR